MNNVLELKGKRFFQAPRNGGGEPRMNSKVLVTIDHLYRLEAQLGQIEDFWKQEKRVFSGILVSVHYNKIVAKSQNSGCCRSIGKEFPSWKLVCHS